MIGGVIGFLVGLGCFSTWTVRRGARRRMARRLYALTNRRALLWEPRATGPGVLVTSYDLREIRRVRRTEYPNGQGDVHFQFGRPGLPAYRAENETGFLGIPEVRRVEYLVRQALIDLRSTNRNQAGADP